VTDIYVFGRRGPAQAAFTNPEIKELGELADADVIVLPEEAALDPLSQEMLAREPDRTAANNVQILQAYAQRAPAGKRRRIHMRFLWSPVELIGTERVEAIRLVKNELQRADDGALRPRATDQTEIIPVGLVFRSIGYKGVALPDVPFDSKAGIIPNQAGRVIDPTTGAPIIGDYVVGWIKRGPSGVIGTNKPDSVESVKMALEDAAAGRVHAPANAERAAVEAMLIARGIEFIRYEDWLMLDRIEQERGRSLGRPRLKFSRVDDMLSAIRAAKSELEPTGD